MKPRARFTRCCSPPEKVAGGMPCSRARDVQPQQQHRAAPVSRGLHRRPRPSSDLGHDVQRGHARHDAQELADIAEGVVPDGQDGARVGGGDVDHLAAMADQDAPAVGAVVAIQAAHQRRFAGARRAGQHDALAGCDRQIDAGQYRQAHAARRCRVKALASASVRNINRGEAHACNTELTSNCV